MAILLLIAFAGQVVAPVVPTPATVRGTAALCFTTPTPHTVPLKTTKVQLRNLTTQQVLVDTVTDRAGAFGFTVPQVPATVAVEIVDDRGAVFGTSDPIPLRTGVVHPPLQVCASQATLKQIAKDEGLNPGVPVWKRLVGKGWLWR